MLRKKNRWRLSEVSSSRLTWKVSPWGAFSSKDPQPFFAQHYIGKSLEISMFENPKQPRYWTQLARICSWFWNAENWFFQRRGQTPAANLILVFLVFLPQTEKLHFPAKTEILGWVSQTFYMQTSGSCKNVNKPRILITKLKTLVFSCENVKMLVRSFLVMHESILDCLAHTFRLTLQSKNLKREQGYLINYAIPLLHMSVS